VNSGTLKAKPRLELGCGVGSTGDFHTVHWLSANGLGRFRNLGTTWDSESPRSEELHAARRACSHYYIAEANGMKPSFCISCNIGHL